MDYTVLLNKDIIAPIEKGFIIKQIENISPYVMYKGTLYKVNETKTSINKAEVKNK